MTTNQKHTVHTDALETLGTIIDKGAERDAIHLAVEPVYAGKTLYPGTRVRLVNQFAFPTEEYDGEEAIGIVDPFLTDPVEKGQRFWLLVLPRTITSLRHVWSHPAFPEAVEQVAVQPSGVKSAKEKSTDWVTMFANSVGLEYHDMMSGADDYLKAGHYINKGELLEGESVPDEFWLHYSILKGKEIPVDAQGSFFSCAC